MLIFTTKILVQAIAEFWLSQNGYKFTIPSQKYLTFGNILSTLMQFQNSQIKLVGLNARHGN